LTIVYRLAVRETEFDGATVSCAANSVNHHDDRGGNPCTGYNALKTIQDRPPKSNGNRSRAAESVPLLPGVTRHPWNSGEYYLLVRNFRPRPATEPRHLRAISKIQPNNERKA
jgi:hypothetical protein